MKEFSPSEWRSLPKEGWHRAIIRWNRRKETMKKYSMIAHAKNSNLFSPKEQKQYDKQRRKGNVSPTITWNEVPTKLPYHITTDRKKMVCDELFLEIIGLLPKAMKTKEIQMMFS